MCACALLVLLAALSAAGSAAASEAVATETFAGTARVVEVRLPLHVVDRGGRPVRGLSADDFRIVDGGKRREIRGFQVIDLDLLRPDAGSTWSRHALEAAARRHFLLLFDLSFSQPTSIVRARVAARELVIHDLHPTDLVAVAIQSVERGARLLVSFTADRALVARAIDSLGTAGLAGAVSHDPIGFLANPGPADGGSSFVPTPEQADRSSSAERASDSDLTAWVLDKEMEKAARGQSEGRVASWNAGLGDLARMLASVPGRKQVLYFSEGFDGQLLFGREQSSLDPGLQDQEGGMVTRRHWSTHTDDRFGSTGLLAQVNRTLERFRQADCVLQAIDISGLANPGRRNDRDHKARRHALFYLARETGGELFTDSNELRRQMGEVLARSALTYLLTFSANDVPEDGSFRPLKVKATLPEGGRLLAPRGYHAPRPFHELHPLEKSLLASEALAAAVPVAEVELAVLAAPFGAGGAGAYVPVIVEVPGGPLLEGMRGSQLPLELYAYATDEAGELRDFFTHLLGLDLGAWRDRFGATGAKFYGHFELPAGEYQIRVLVRNGQTGRAGLAIVPLEIPDFRQPRPFLLPPFFIEDPGAWLLIREKTSEAAEAVVYPFTVAGQPFIPAARPTLKAGESAELCLVLYNPGAGRVEVDGTILTADGGPAASAVLGSVVRVPTGTEGVAKLTATFAAAELDPGDYLLRIEVTDPQTGTTEVSSIPFRLQSG